MTNWSNRTEPMATSAAVVTNTTPMLCASACTNERRRAAAMPNTSDALPTTAKTTCAMNEGLGATIMARARALRRPLVARGPTFCAHPPKKKMAATATAAARPPLSDNAEWCALVNMVYRAVKRNDADATGASMRSINALFAAEHRTSVRSLVAACARTALREQAAHALEALLVSVPMGRLIDDSAGTRALYASAEYMALGSPMQATFDAYRYRWLAPAAADEGTSSKIESAASVQTGEATNAGDGQSRRLSKVDDDKSSKSQKDDDGKVGEMQKVDNGKPSGSPKVEKSASVQTPNAGVGPSSALNNRAAFTRPISLPVPRANAPDDNAMPQHSSSSSSSTHKRKRGDAGLPDQCARCLAFHDERHGCVGARRSARRTNT